MSSSIKGLLEIMLCRPLLSRKDLSRRYNRTLDCIDKWRRSGKLPYPLYLPGCRSPFWRPCDIDRFEQRLRIKSIIKRPKPLPVGTTTGNVTRIIINRPKPTSTKPTYAKT